MDGLWLWAHYAPADATQLVAKIKAAGAAGVLLKYHDGASATDDTGFNYQARFRSLVGPLKAAGFGVAAWGYNYPDQPSAEAQLIAQSFADGAEWYCFDAETEFDNAAGAAAAEALGAAVRAAVGPDRRMGYAPFPIADLHPLYPYRQFDAVCQLALPQVYWRDLGVTPDAAYNRCWFGMKALGLKASWQPIGECGAGVASADLRRFAWLCKNGGITGISLWSLDGLADPGSLHVATDLYPAPKDAPAVTDPSATAPDVASALGALHQAEADLTRPA